MLIHNASELENYAKQEEEMIERMVKEVADSGAKVVVAGSSIGEMAMHFIEKFGLMAVRIPSKFDLRRFCRCAPHVSSMSHSFYTLARQSVPVS